MKHRTAIIDGMVIVTQHKIITARLKKNVRNEVRDFIRNAIPTFEEKRKFQLSWNHKHCASKKEAVQLAKEVSADFTRRYPDYAYQLAVDWREAGHDEKGNVVLISFWRDHESSCSCPLLVLRKEYPT